MPRIFDNIDQQLLPALCETLQRAHRADFCVGYFNLRGWRRVDADISNWEGGEGNCCRVLVGMQKLPRDELQDALSVLHPDTAIDNQTALARKRELAEEFRKQLTYGAPNNADEEGLRRLARELRGGQLRVKLFLRHPLHAKLYLLFRRDPVNPAVAFLGSSNLTFPGLCQQGELNVDVMDHDACEKLASWFNDRWDDRWCVDITKELLQIIEESWAREELIPPYQIYLKMVYHLSREARAGLEEFRIPEKLEQILFEYQSAAVRIAAHHLDKRGGVLIGDVVGLGKTLMATAIARIFEDDFDIETLILCPKNLVPMWESYREEYGLRGKVLSVSRVLQRLPKERRYRLVLIDESHNFRNRKGKTYRVIQEYIRKNDSRVILLSATPYNKTYEDLSNQLRLFLDEHHDIGIRPERLIRERNELYLLQRQIPVRTLRAFEESPYADDWRDLMRLYLVRRTRSFIQNNYGTYDETAGRWYLTFADGSRSYFPVRQPCTLKFSIDEQNPTDQYARLYSADVVNAINRLDLPRYGLGNYVLENPIEKPTPDEEDAIVNLARAGKRLIGFSRTNLFKRLESSGEAFIQSVERHIVRNYVHVHAIENGLPLPIGTQDVAALDTRFTDQEDSNDLGWLYDGDEGDSATDDNDAEDSANGAPGWTVEAIRSKAAAIYDLYRNKYQRRFKWLRPSLFHEDLVGDLEKDAEILLGILKSSGPWEPGRDEKLRELMALVRQKHPNEKVLVFSQFADTVYYLNAQLEAAGLTQVTGVTGSAANPTAAAWRFSPVSNEKRREVAPEDELRVLLATDVLSEGQNLQDCAIIVNYDLPWAIIRLIQRAGRVDRIGQKARDILCYTFMPADGVERIINLRGRLRHRLRENREVVGTDESFFEGDDEEAAIRDLYTEKAGILDDEDDNDVDLASRAYEIWKKAIERDPSLEKTIASMPDVVYSARSHKPEPTAPSGALVYARTADGTDSLVWMNDQGESVTESQLAVLKAAECKPATPAVERAENHHDLVTKALEQIAEEEKSVGGQLGRTSGARFRTYERLKRLAEDAKGTVFDTDELRRVVDLIYRYPLRQFATDTLNRHLRSGISHEALAELAITLHRENRLVIVHEEDRREEPRIVCSLGLRRGN